LLICNTLREDFHHFDDSFHHFDDSFHHFDDSFHHFDDSLLYILIKFYNTKFCFYIEKVKVIHTLYGFLKLDFSPMD